MENEGITKLQRVGVIGAGAQPAGGRTLPKVDFVAGRKVGDKIPVDVVAKGAVIRMKGRINASWSASAPTDPSKGVLETLVKNIEWKASDDVIKSLTPEQLKYMVDLRTGKNAPDLLNVGSATLGTGTTESIFQWGTTGQEISFQASVYIPFENNLISTPDLTYFDSSRHLRTNYSIDCAELEDLNPGLTGTGFSIDDSEIEFEVHLITSDEDLGKPFRNYRQTYIDTSFDGANLSKLIDVKREALIMGMTLEFTFRDTATGDIRPVFHDEADKILVGLVRNGKTSIKDKISLANLMQENFNKLDISTFPDGKVYYNFLQNRSLSSALVAYLFNTLNLDVTMDNTLNFANGTYGLRIHFNEVMR